MKQKSKLLLFFLLICLLFSSLVPTSLPIAAATADYYEPYVYENPEKYPNDKLPYQFHVPEESTNSTEKYPLVIFLHGAGERGNDNEKQLSYVTAASRLVSKSNREKYPCYIVAPQCPSNQQWVNTPWANGNYSTEQVKISTPLSMLMDLIDELCQNQNIDQTRIYVTGLSMGGFGTWDLITRFPNKFAAAIPICGGGDPSKADNIKHIPICTFHGAIDDIVPVAGTREMVAQLESAGSKNITYTEYKNLGHGIWESTYGKKDLYEWLFAQKLEVPPTPTETTSIVPTPSTVPESESHGTPPYTVFIVGIIVLVVIVLIIGILLLKRKKGEKHV